MKQVVGDAYRGDDCPDSARALHQGQDIKEIARDLNIDLIAKIVNCSHQA
jgi:hypothetical protein